MKLIRDLTPDLKRGSTRRCVTDDEFQLALRAKLMEEAAEVSAATSREEMLAELGDLHTVMRHLEETNNISSEEVANSAIEKMNRKGSFHGRLLLLWDPLSNKT